MKPTSLTPVTMPVAILTFKKAKLPEKLLLAMFAADPKATRVRLVMSMTRAGLRKLEQRLVQKKLLSLESGRYMVHIPDIVHIDQLNDGHFVSSSHATKNQKKVARPLSKTTPTDITQLPVPEEILRTKYLKASEKVLLAFFTANPSSTNERVLATLGLSSSGLKKLKSGLLRKRVLISTGTGFTIRLPGYVLVRDSNGGHFISEPDAAKTGYKVATPAPKLTPAADIFDAWAIRDKKLLRPGTPFGELQSYTAKMLRRVESESPDSPEREVALRRMKQKEDFYFALQFVYENIPRRHEPHYTKLICNGTPEQLAAFRERVEGMTLAGGLPEPKLLALLTKSISQ